MSSSSRSFGNTSEEDQKSEKETLSKEEKDLEPVNNLVNAISEILKAIINSDENKKIKNKGTKQFLIFSFRKIGCFYLYETA